MGSIWGWIHSAIAWIASHPQAAKRLWRRILGWLDWIEEPEELLPSVPNGLRLGEQVVCPECSHDVCRKAVHVSPNAYIERDHFLWPKGERPVPSDPMNCPRCGGHYARSNCGTHEMHTATGWKTVTGRQ